MSEKKYKVQINPPKPERDEVDRHKDFDRLLRQHRVRKRRSPLHVSVNKLNALLPIAILAILLLLWLVFGEGAGQNDELPKQTPTPAQQSSTPSLGSELRAAHRR